MESKKLVNTYIVDYECPECGEGVLKPTGEVLTSFPAQYPHKCTHCNHTETFRETYPKTVVEPIQKENYTNDDFRSYYAIIETTNEIYEVFEQGFSNLTVYDANRTKLNILRKLNQMLDLKIRRTGDNRPNPLKTLNYGNEKC
jgi:hypothetical protein